MSQKRKFIESIPVLGWFVRWTYNILRINNTKYKLQILEKKLNKLSLEHQKLNFEYQELNSEHQKLYSKFKNQEEVAYELVRKHISSQLIHFHQKIDTFIENADEVKAKNLKNNINQDFFDEYYLNFENKFRGSRDSILKRYKDYLCFVPFLDENGFNSNKTLDIGCGRGEWVQLLQEKGIDAYGIDMNPMMLKMAKENNLKNIYTKDAFEYMRKTQENSFDLITAFHIIEHISFKKLVNLLQQIKRVAKPDATILLETPNPENIQVAACNFYTDPTHLNPLPAKMIKFLMEYLGFVDVKINYLNPNTSASSAQDYLIVAKNSISAYDKVKKKLLFDISLYHKKNLKTGIHRVVSEQLKGLETLNQNEYEIIPVYLDEIEKSNSSIKSFGYYTLDNIFYSLDNVSYGDVLFTSDLSYSDIQKATQNGIYDSYKKRGVKIVFLVHDILPLQYEHFFVKGTKKRHEIYLENVCKVADLIIVTTKTGKKDLENYCQNSILLPKIKVLNLGSNFNMELLKDSKLKSHQGNFLMVGTIEPRKAHNQVIRAFDILWKQTLESKSPTLTIIGKKGWLVEETINNIKQHPQYNKKLFYIEKADDQELNNYYNKSDAIILASHAEGFGLPLVEAIYYKKPVIARDIPVFREIANNYPYYFKDTLSPNDLIEAISKFLNNPKSKYKSNYESLYITWEEHSRKLIKIIKKL